MRSVWRVRLQNDAIWRICVIMERYGDDGYGDKPEGMSRVQYWAQHLDMAKFLGEQEKVNANTCPHCRKTFKMLSRHNCKKRPRFRIQDLSSPACEPPETSCAPSASASSECAPTSDAPHAVA